jgi:ATP adenylyltransferase
MTADLPTSPDGPPPGAFDHLWSTWRSAYLSGEDPIEGCPFCVLPARSPDRDRESLILTRANTSFVIFNAYPYNPGHLMVIPYEHVESLEDLDDETNDEMWRLTRLSARAVRERLGCDGVNLGANLGSAAGAGIADHVHLHVVPRWVGDTNFVSVVGGTRVMSRSLHEVYDDLAPAFS